MLKVLKSEHDNLSLTNVIRVLESFVEFDKLTNALDGNLCKLSIVSIFQINFRNDVHFQFIVKKLSIALGAPDVSPDVK